MTTTTTRLGDLGTSHVWFTSVGQPAGCDLQAEENDSLHLPGDSIGGDGPWWDLEGAVEGKRWTWDGQGKPTDHRANTVTKIVAYLE